MGRIMIDFSEARIRDILTSQVGIRYGGVTYERALSFKMCISYRGKFVRSLELVKRRKRLDGGYYETRVWAPIEECEVVG